MFRNTWIRALFLIQACQISYPVFSLDDNLSVPFINGVNITDHANSSSQPTGDVISNESQNQTHRVIRRFAPRFHFPPPPPHLNLPTLPRPMPNFPFPLFDRNVKGDEEESDESGETTIPPPESPGDRTLLAAKKAIILKKAVLAKKAIILAKLKKKAIFKKKKKKKFKKKAIIAGLASYGYSKIKGGVSIKTPNIKLTVGGPKEKEEEEEEEAEDDTVSQPKKKKQKQPNSQNDNNNNDNNNNIQDKQQQNVPGPSAPTPETYTSGKKKGKKKKKKGIPKPRPVDLGVKANLYKKFDKAAKKAKNQLSSYVQIDIDFLGRAAIDDMIEPGRFTSRIAQVSASMESNEVDYVNDVEVPANFIPFWEEPKWSREYPPRKNNVNVDSKKCCLKPVYVLFSLSKDSDNI